MRKTVMLLAGGLTSILTVGYAAPSLAHPAAASPKASVAAEPMRGVYIRGDTVAKEHYARILDRLAQREMNAIVLDAKDYDGMLTYPSKVPLANEAGAVAHPPISDLRAAIRQAHERKIRVIMRVSSFEDEHMAKARPLMSVRSKGGHAYPIGWLDPSNEDAQNYVIALVEESIAAGADEIELDYVRYPVLGIKNANFHLAERGLTQTTVIRDFVRRVHHVTQAHGVPLSLDVFGVIAFGHPADINALGQDPAMLAPECEALSPMVYPSHFAPGFNGWDEPGDHPEIVGMGTAAMRLYIAAHGVTGGAIIRPWLQAASYKSPVFSAGPTHYLAEEIRTSDRAGAVGWLMWNPGQDYGYAWPAVPKREVDEGASSGGRSPGGAALAVKSVKVAPARENAEGRRTEFLVPTARKP